MANHTDEAIDINTQFLQALTLLEESRTHVFVTGRAGTGKSTLLRHFRLHTKKNIVVLAPTGVAAVTIGGQTIHSFFHFRPDITVQKVKKMRVDSEAALLYQRLETMVIDEISMVRADLLDCVDTFLRIHGPVAGKPFGGVQMVFIGDLYQLPPVTTQDDRGIFSEHYDSPYFFSAHVFSPKQRSLLTDKDLFQLEFIELEKVYRQNDNDFIHLLNTIRSGTAGEAEFARINTRLNPDFDPPPDARYIYLTTTNAMADEVNERKLNQLDTDNYFFPGTTEGSFDEKYLPTAAELHMKIGAQVMMLNNDPGGRWINGTIGTVERVERGGDDEPRTILVCFESGVVERVHPYRWEIYQFSFNKELNHVESEAVGAFTQYPLKLSWAVTIHKSQGKTFDKMIIDIGRGTFSPGQLYVALSRATTLSGIVLKRPIRKQHVWLDPRIAAFIASVQR